MAEKNYRQNLLFIFAFTLLIAISLQSVAITLLDLRASIHERIQLETQWLIDFSDLVGTENRRVTHQELNDNMGQQGAKIFHFLKCGKMALDDLGDVSGAGCRYPRIAEEGARKAEYTTEPVVIFAGGGWPAFLGMGTHAILALSIHSDTGRKEVWVSEIELLKVFTGYRERLYLVLSYLAVNVLISSLLIFVRLEKRLFRPLQKLLDRAEAYHDNKQLLQLQIEDSGPFRFLSGRLNEMFARIEADNSLLRENIRQLEIANIELKKKNEIVIRTEKLATVGRLSAGMAHEIGNPLAIVQGYVELLALDKLDHEKKKDCADKAGKEIERISALLRQLLDYARQRKPYLEKFSIHSTISETVNLSGIASKIEESGIVLKLSAENDIILTDREMLRQVLVNVLINAVDSLDSINCKDRQLVITTANTNKINSEGKGEGITIVIEDNGVGIPEENLAKVFDPFFTTKDVGKGTGLGLFVCNSIIEGLGGEIRLCNREMGGAELTIKLPLMPFIENNSYTV